MSDMTTRLALPFLLPGQAQKEHYHNEALVRIDALLHPAVEGAPEATPPQAPLAGQCWLVAAGATGEWTGHAGEIAAWTESGWRFVAPPAGTLVWSKPDGYWLHFDGSAWSDGALPARSIHVGGQQVVGPREPPVPSPYGGTIIDAEARAAITQITAALMSHGLIG